MPLLCSCHWDIEQEMGLILSRHVSEWRAKMGACYRKGLKKRDIVELITTQVSFVSSCGGKVHVYVIMITITVPHYMYIYILYRRWEWRLALCLLKSPKEYLWENPCEISGLCVHSLCNICFQIGEDPSVIAAQPHSPRFAMAVCTFYLLNKLLFVKAPQLVLNSLFFPQLCTIIFTNV